VVDDAPAVAFGSAAAPRPCPAGAIAPEYGGRAPCGSGSAVLACLVGWSEPGNKPRAVSLVERPGDAPARGDHHPARIGDRQRPQMHLLAEARRRPSLHPADLRLALPRVPGPRPGVLQPQRPAVPGARHRAAGGGTGPSVADQGDNEGRHCPAQRGHELTAALCGERLGRPHRRPLPPGDVWQPTSPRPSLSRRRRATVASVKPADDQVR
jgi:hypothetical protein